MIASWIAADPEGEPVAVFATTGAGLKALATIGDVEDVIGLAYEGDGVFSVAADDAMALIDDDDVILRRTSTGATLLTWPTTSAWRTLAMARGMCVWLLAETDAEQWRERRIVDVLADEREGVLIVAVERQGAPSSSPEQG